MSFDFHKKFHDKLGFIHESIFAFETNFHKNLLLLAFAIVFSVGFFSLKDAVLALPKNLVESKSNFARLNNELERRGWSPDQISENISSAPYYAYKAVNEITDFYSEKLAYGYLKVGDLLIFKNQSGIALKNIIENPPVYVINKMKEVSVGEAEFIEGNLASVVNFVTSFKEELTQPKNSKIQYRRR